MTAIERQALEDAQDKLTIEMLKNLGYGDEIKLNSLYTLYHYLEDDCIVIVLTESWEEVLQVLYSEDEIVFYAL